MTRPALVITWSRDEPERVGEVLLLPSSGAAGATVVGRGDEREDDPGPRGTWIRQRPGPAEAQPPLAASGVSRCQLEVRSVEGTIEAVNVGRCPLSVGGRAVERARLQPGETLALDGQMLLTYERRPARLPRLESWPRSLQPAFGAADRHGFVGETPIAWDTRDRIAWVAARKPHVLILGASGTGKELAANAIHALSDRGRRPIVARNAATLPASLVDAELFGNVRDYPNPGMAERTGLIGEADTSTLFLDEIAELPEALQAHLLRVLDEGDYQRLGEAKNRSADFRLVAATNRPVAALKHDLLARLRMRIELPGLDQRRTDVPLLARHLVRRIGDEDPGIASKFCSPAGEPRFTQSLMMALLRHPWTHHVRELDAVLWASIGSSAGSRLDLTAQVRAELDRQASGADAGTAPDEVTATELRAAMEKHGGVRERVWRDLGLKNRWVLGRLLKKHGL